MSAKEAMVNPWEYESPGKKSLKPISINDSSQSSLKEEVFDKNYDTNRNHQMRVASINNSQSSVRTVFYYSPVKLIQVYYSPLKEIQVLNTPLKEIKVEEIVVWSPFSK